MLVQHYSGGIDLLGIDADRAGEGGGNGGGGGGGRGGGEGGEDGGGRGGGERWRKLKRHDGDDYYGIYLEKVKVNDARAVGHWAVERDDFDDYNVFDGGTDRTCPPDEAICFWNLQMYAIGQGAQYEPEDNIDHWDPPFGGLGDTSENFGHAGSGVGDNGSFTPFPFPPQHSQNC